MTKSIVILLAGTALLLADEASKNAKIEEIMVLSHSDRMMTQSLDQMKNMVLAQVSKADMPAEARQASEEMQKKMMAMIADRLSWDKAKPVFIKVYADTFTEPEIDGILAFYKSPAGQAMLDKMPQLMQKSMAAGQQLMGDVQPEIERMMKEAKEKNQSSKP